MKREKSCGAVLFREEGTRGTYLILHSTQGHWSLCKGHVEGSETEHETATREIREETGLRVDYVENFREVITYSPYPGCMKDVVFFLARVVGGELICQPEEVAEAVFLPFRQAMERLTHSSDRDILRKAHLARCRAVQAGHTPLYDCLRRFSGEDTLRLDMPGHHGRVFPVDGLADISLDVTENGRTGDLFGGEGDAIEAAEALWAEVCGFDSCLFLTGGSTQGNHTGLALLAGAGSKVLVDRGSHRSVYNAMALLDQTPCYLSRPWLEEQGVFGPVSPAEVERALSGDPEIRAVCIVSPTYYGVCSDLTAIAGVCRAHGAKLLVDGAHGAHLSFGFDSDYCAVDAVVVSAHKTLPALGQSALLLANGCSLDELRQFGAVYGSSSPSYLLMASLDLARDWMLREGAARHGQTAELVGRLRGEFPALRSGRERLDPTRLVVMTGDGFALEAALKRRGIFPEMADRNHVVFIFTAADGEKEAQRLAEALRELLPAEKAAGYSFPAPPELPEAVLSLRDALFAPRETIPLAESAGHISASQLAPYPPGIPVIAPGERIGKKHLAYLQRIGYNKEYIEIVAGS